MSQNSINLSLPYIQGGQAQKHVTHNEAIRTLDAIVQLCVRDRVQAPQADVQDGDRFIVAAGAVDSFEGHEGEIALFEGGAWNFIAARKGWIAYDEATASPVVFDGNGWLNVAGTGVSGGGSVNSTDRLGINTAADSTNRLATASDATLLTHDASGGHQLKVNKSTPGDTASLLFQTGFSARAEMGTAGTDDFEIKVSPDGSNFRTALQVNRETGAVSLPNTALARPEYGEPSLITQAYTISRGAGMVSNATGYLANNYNYPAAYAFDPAETPNMPGAFAKSGYYSGAEEMEEFVALDPNRLYRVGVYMRQESMPGDWSGYANGERHIHYMGFRCYDIDGLTIMAAHHTRYHHAGQDSLTELSAPLAPGDSIVDLADASGWNESTSSSYERGLVIFGYRNSLGKAYELYSRIEDIDLFDLGAVDKAQNRVTLKQPLPASMGNPDDPGGVWPVGTRIANRGSGWNYKFGFFSDLVLGATDTWYRIENVMGGVDLSGRNVPHNFPPGTAQVRPVWLMNYSNRSGGYSSFPDTGPDHRTWVTGVSVEVDPAGKIVRQTDGSCSLHVLEGDPQSGAVSMVTGTRRITAT